MVSFLGCGVALVLLVAFAVTMRDLDDLAVNVGGRIVQVEYLACLSDPSAIWYEDGSADC